MNYEELSMPRNRQEQGEHEHRVCLAAAEMLSRIHGRPIRITCKPDSTDSSQQRCDYKAIGEGVHQVIEHTLIEAYPKRLATGVRFRQVFDGLKTEYFANGVGVNGRFKLICECREDLMGSMNRQQVKDRLSEWVRQNAPALATDAENKRGSQKYYPASISAQPPGVPFQVALRCRAAQESCLLVSSRVPDYLEDMTKERLKTALERKCPKLAKWRRHFSTLVLEENDLSLGNELSTAAHLYSLRSENGISFPDFVIYVDTAISNEWVVHLLKRNNEFSGEPLDFLELNPQELNPDGLSVE